MGGGRRNPEGAGGGPNSPADQLRGIFAVNKDPADHHVFAGKDEAAGGDVDHLRGAICIEIVNLYQPDTGGTAFAAKDCSVAARRERKQDGRFVGILRRQTTRQNLSGVWIAGPIIIDLDECAVAATQLQGRILERICYTEDSKGRPDTTNDNAFGLAALDNETGDKYVVPGFDPQTGGNISQMRAGCRSRGRGWRRYRCSGRNRSCGGSCCRTSGRCWTSCCARCGYRSRARHCRSSPGRA